MREQLRQEVLRRFAGAPDTQQARDLRDEILSNTLQRYDDLLLSLIHISEPTRP